MRLVALEARTKQSPKTVVTCITANYEPGECSAESLKCSWILSNMAEDCTRSDLETL